MIKHLLVVALATSSLSGCTPLVTAYTGRSVTAHTLAPNRLFTMTAERRFGIMVPTPAGGTYFCAEGSPDVAQAVGAASQFAATLSATENAQFREEFKTALLQIYQRSDNLEDRRMMYWQACQAYAQGAIGRELYEAVLLALQTSGIENSAARATIAPAPLGPGRNVGVEMTPIPGAPAGGTPNPPAQASPSSGTTTPPQDKDPIKSVGS